MTVNSVFDSGRIIFEAKQQVAAGHVRRQLGTAQGEIQAECSLPFKGRLASSDCCIVAEEIGLALRVSHVLEEKRRKKLTHFVSGTPKNL